MFYSLSFSIVKLLFLLAGKLVYAEFGSFYSYFDISKRKMNYFYLALLIDVVIRFLYILGIFILLIELVGLVSTQTAHFFFLEKFKINITL